LGFFGDFPSSLVFLRFFDFAVPSELGGSNFSAKVNRTTDLDEPIFCLLIANVVFVPDVVW